MSEPAPTPTPTPAPAALIFDMDGTLADTMPAHWAAWQATARKYGLELSEDRFYQLGGVPTHNILEMLAKEAGVAMDVPAVTREKELLAESLLENVQPIAAVVAIAQANAGKLPMAVATSAFRHVADKTLASLGLTHLFQSVVTVEDVHRGKPAPDLYLEAARQLGVEPTLCRAYEDADAGIASARAAGMDVVDIRELIR